MKKFLFSVCAVLAILGCGGENIENLPPLNPGRNYGGDGDYGYCRYFWPYGSYDDYNCEYMSISDCNSHSGVNYGDDSDCGYSYYYPSSSSNRSSSSSIPNYKVSGSPVYYEGETYQTVVIGNQTWMAKNLNYNPGTGNSACYNNNSSNCGTYGRLYNWSTAMNLPSDCNSNSCSSQINSPHRGICPSGWHIPSNADWDKLFRYVDGTSGTSSPYDSPTAGRYLKATSGWDSSGNGTDQYGFSALLGGHGISDGNFSIAGYYGYWWSASEYNSYYAYYRFMFCSIEDAYWIGYNKSNLFSVRCLQD
jgi:uncharacterized protein (TIGR02145 family)